MPTQSLVTFIGGFLQRQRGIFIAILMTTVVWALDQTVWPLLIQVIVDIFTEFEDKRQSAWAALSMPALWCVLLWLGVEAGFRLQGYLMAKAMPQLEANVRMTIFDHVQRHSPRYFSDQLSGSLANKINDVAIQVGRLMRIVLLVFIPTLLACVLANLFLFQVHPTFAFLLMGWIVVHMSLCVLFARGCDTREHLHAEVRSHLIGKIVDSFTNNYAVNLFHRFDQERHRLSHDQDREQETNTVALKYMEYMRAILGLSGCLIGGMVMNGLLIYYWVQGEISTGQAVQTFNTMWNMTMVMWVAGAEIPNTFQAIGMAKQALLLLDDPQDILDAPGATPLAVNEGKIVFNDVMFHHGTKKIFEKKNVVIEGGTKVGLVGFSGSGKSTFISLILRLFPTCAGSITIDGHDISTITLQSLREQISLVPQDPLLFHRTIRENIAVGRPGASEAEIIDAARQAHCLEFISNQAEGFDRMVGERGSKLSGGERQRIAIARAMLADTPILLLDEATSALDAITERYLQDSLYTLMQGRTSLIIAHRLSTLENMDRILVFDKGRIVEDGSHRELLQQQGHYATMWRMQTGDFLTES